MLFRCGTCGLNGDDCPGHFGRILFLFYVVFLSLLIIKFYIYLNLTRYRARRASLSSCYICSSLQTAEEAMLGMPQVHVLQKTRTSLILFPKKRTKVGYKRLIIFQMQYLVKQFKYLDAGELEKALAMRKKMKYPSPASSFSPSLSFFLFLFLFIVLLSYLQ